MAGEVTMKDLQSLQGYVNKQDADLRKQLTGFQTDIDNLKQSLKGTDKVIEVLPFNMGVSDMKKRIAALEATVKTLSAAVDKLRNESSRM